MRDHDAAAIAVRVYLTMEPKRVGIAILAAGASQRMGCPKQLLVHCGRTLVRHSVETAVESLCRPIVVVIGAHAELIRHELHGLPVAIAQNSAWECGMSSSLRVAIETLATVTDAEIDGAVITLCDQPLVTSDAIDTLVRMHYKTGKDIVASEYADTNGVPAFISRRLFDEAAALNGNDGARRLIARHPQAVATVPLIEAALDVDTPDDYERLKSIICGCKQQSW